MYKDNKVKEFRAKSKLTQREVAKLLNMTQANYCDIENGKVIPNANQILMMCTLYKCTPNDLLGVHGIYQVATKDWDE